MLLETLCACSVALVFIVKKKRLDIGGNILERKILSNLTTLRYASIYIPIVVEHHCTNSTRPLSESPLKWPSNKSAQITQPSVDS